MLENFENVLGLPLPAAKLPDIGTGIDVRVAHETDHEAWLDVIVAGFANPDMQGVPSHEEFSREVMDQTVGDMATASRFARYLAYRDGVLAGGASLCLCEGVAQLCGAATAPAHRRRGLQSALLAMRLAEAARQGCDIAVVTTQPGSKSQQNVQRQGSSYSYTRAIHARDPGTDSVRAWCDPARRWAPGGVRRGLSSPTVIAGGIVGRESCRRPAPARVARARSAGRG